MFHRFEKEYMTSMEELKKKFPLNSKVTVNGVKCIVKAHKHPMNSTCMASYPTVVFEVAEKDF